MAVLTETHRKIKNLAAFLGLIQGVAWIVMGAICVVLHLQGPDTSLTHYDSYMRLIQLYISSLFLHESLVLPFSDHLLNPKAFNVFMWIQIVFNFIWVVASFNVLCSSQRNLNRSLKLWSVITWMVCLCDLVMVVLLGIDYKTCLRSGRYTLDKVSVEAFCANGILPVLVIAARGFVLWIQNMAFSITLFTMSTHLTQANVRVVQARVFPQVTTGQVQPQANVQRANPTHHNQPSSSSSAYFTASSPVQEPSYSPAATPSPIDNFSGYSNSFDGMNSRSVVQHILDGQEQTLYYTRLAHQTDSFPLPQRRFY